MCSPAGKGSFCFSGRAFPRFFFQRQGTRAACRTLSALPAPDAALRVFCRRTEEQPPDARRGTLFSMNIFSLKCFALQTIRPVVYRKKTLFFH